GSLFSAGSKFLTFATGRITIFPTILSAPPASERSSRQVARAVSNLAWRWFFEKSSLSFAFACEKTHMYISAIALQGLEHAQLQLEASAARVIQSTVAS